MKKPVVIMMALLLLAGAGGGAYMFLFPAPAEAAAAEEETVNLKAPPDYFTMSPFMLPVVNERGLQEFVTMSVALEVKNKDVVDHLKLIEPRLRDRIFRSLYGAFSDGSAFTGHTIDVELVLEHVRAAATETVGENVVQDVLIQRVAQQRR